MSILRSLTSGLRTLFHKEEVEQEMDEELRGFLDAAVKEKMRSGMSQDEALRAARVEMGRMDGVKEEIRSSGWESTLGTLWQDVRYGFRQLKRNPGFAAVAVVTLALGIGVNTAIFSLIDQLLLWSIPAREANRLVKIEGVYSSTYPFYCAYRDLNQVFSGVLASSENLDTGIRPDGAPGVEVGHVEYVSGGYFQIQGIGSAAGRVITPSDDVAPGGSPVAVLSYRYWQRRFAGDLRVIGRKLAVNTYPLVIVGVAEKGFGGLFNGEEPDAFIPLTMYPVTTPSAARAWNTTQMYWLTSVARLKPGVSIQQAQAGMQVLWSQAVQTVNAAAPKGGPKVPKSSPEKLLLTPAAHGDSFMRNRVFLDPLKALAIATALVLLIACANVAGLLLARASQRWKETAVRLALGATRGRLIRQFLTESLLLAAAGSVVGLAVAYFGIWALAKLAILNPDLRFHLSFFVLLSCAGVTLLTSILFGLVPAFRSTRITLAESMKESGSATQTISRSRISKALVSIQVALALMLLVTASLFVRTLRNLYHVDLGFQPQNIAIFDIDPTNLGYRGQRLRAFYDQLLEHAREVHGVRSAALSGEAPMTFHCRGGYVSNEKSEPKPGEDFTLLNPVSAEYFTTLGIPLLLGSDFRSEDEPAVTLSDSPLAQLGRSSGGAGGPGTVDASRVCIIDEWEARHLFGAVNPVGRYLWHGEQAIEIVGVVKNVHGEMVTRPDQVGTVYEPNWPNGAEVRWLLVRYAGSADPVITGIRRALQDQDPNVPLRVRLMDEYVSSHLPHERLIAYLSSFFGILALGLGSVGLYGVLAYAVTRRTREIGIRMALGAQRRAVIGLIFRESIVLVLAGVVIGSVGAFFWTLFIGDLLYGVDSFDLESTLLPVTVMLGAALLAAAIPARRATKVDPMVALRYE
jgi:predicted permease